MASPTTSKWERAGVRVKSLHDKARFYLATTGKHHREARAILEAVPGLSGATDNEVERVLAVLGTALCEERTE